MTSAKLIFRHVARWTDVRTIVRTSVTGRGHPEPRKRHRRGTKLDRTEVRSTTAEKSKWRRQAQRFDLSLSEFMRVKMNDSEVRIVLASDPALLNELRRQGNNFNQLMHAIHAGFPIKADRVMAAIEALQDFYRQEIRRG